MHLFQIVVEAFANVQANEPHPVAIAVSPGNNLQCIDPTEKSLSNLRPQDLYPKQA